MCINIARAFAIAVVVMLVAGCVNPLPRANLALDAQAKTFSPSPDRANVYVFRNEHLGALIRMSVTVDERQVGLTRGMTYLFLQLKPGQHAVYSQEDVTNLISLKVEAGKNYFVWQEVTNTFGSFVYHSKLHIVDEKTGRAGVNECELVVSAQGADSSP